MINIKFLYCNLKKIMHFWRVFRTIFVVGLTDSTKPNWLVYMLVLGSVVAASPSRAGTVAITVDDLPIYANDFPPQKQAQLITNGLLEGFMRYHWPVTGFVIAGELTGRHSASRTNLLKQWLNAGFDLGNHTYSHYSLSITPVQTFIRDAERGDKIVNYLLAQSGKSERWFRYPYLETGRSRATRRAMTVWLAVHHLHSAPVTIQNYDWEFAEPYDDAVLHGRQSEASQIKAEYLNYTGRIIAWHRQAARDVLGREPAYVLLIHANRLNSVSIDPLNHILSRADLKPVSLDQALADPSYQIPDTYLGSQGLSWLYRWALTLGKQMPEVTRPRVPNAIAAAYRRIQAADPDLRAPPHPAGAKG